MQPRALKLHLLLAISGRGQLLPSEASFGPRLALCAPLQGLAPRPVPLACSLVSWLSPRCSPFPSGTSLPLCPEEPCLSPLTAPIHPRLADLWAGHSSRGWCRRCGKQQCGLGVGRLLRDACL